MRVLRNVCLADRLSLMVNHETSEPEVTEAPVDDELSRELAELASIWADLLLVRQSLHDRKEMKKASQMFIRRALWEQAVIAYARCFTTGRRRQLPESLRQRMVGGSVKVHDEIMRWRNQHVAHRVESDFEEASVTLTYRSDEDEPVSTRIRVRLSMGPEDERLADALATLADGLKDRLWPDWFPRLEEQLLDRYRADSEKRAAAAVVNTVSTPSAYITTINPTNRGSVSGR